MQQQGGDKYARNHHRPNTCIENTNAFLKGHFVLLNYKGCTKKCPILNLVYISVNFQATGSIQISLNFSFKYNSNSIHFFSTILGSKVMKTNVRRAGKIKRKLLNGYSAILSYSPFNINLCNL